MCRSYIVSEFRGGGVLPSRYSPISLNCLQLITTLYIWPRKQKFPHTPEHPEKCDFALAGRATAPQSIWYVSGLLGTVLLLPITTYATYLPVCQRIMCYSNLEEEGNYINWQPNWHGNGGAVFEWGINIWIVVASECELGRRWKQLPKQYCLSCEQQRDLLLPPPPLYSKMKHNEEDRQINLQQ